MKFDPTKYERSYRPNFELTQAFWWQQGVFASGIGSLVYLATHGFAVWPVWAATASACAAMSLYRRHQAVQINEKHKKLRGMDLVFTDFEALKEKVFPEYKPGMSYDDIKGTSKAVWLGNGFMWEKDQIQKLTEIVSGNLESLDLQPVGDSSGGFSDKTGEAAKKGLSAIHGLGEETDIYQPLSHISGHTLILGTTGAGKTRLFDLLISQAIMRGESVLIFDPKGDEELEKNAKRACEIVGKPQLFVSVQLKDPKHSAKIDPLANFEETTELASRIKCLMGPGDDDFKKYATAFATSIFEGMTMAGEKPTLNNLYKYVQSGSLPSLVCKIAQQLASQKEDYESNLRIALCTADFPEGISGVNVLKGSMAVSRNKQQAVVMLSDIQKAQYWVAYLRHFLMEDDSRAVRNAASVVSYFEHDQEHLGKMLSSLTAGLTDLTAGEIGTIVNPKSHAPDENFLNLKDLTHGRRVVYIGLNTLQYQVPGRALGAILLSDLAQVAADRYNYSRDMEPLNIFVDECAEIANDPLIALLNKGRGAKFQIYCASQTIADFTTRLESKDKTESALGNFNNMICLRLRSAESMNYFSDNCMKTKINYVMHTQSTSISADNPMTASANSGERLMEEEAELVPPQVLGMLPDLEYFASLSGGKIFKGRLPILSEEKAKLERSAKIGKIGTTFERFAKKCLLIRD